MKKGIDVSTWQGNIDYNKVKASGIEFVIIRAGFGREPSQVDNCFEKNYKNAKAAGLKVGAYWYSYAVSVNDARLEADACMQVLKGKTFDLPIFYDIEERFQFDKGKSFCSQIAIAFCDKLKSNGLRPGLYMSISPLCNYITDEVQKAYPLWIAQYNNVCQYDGNYAIWQYSDNGKVSGVDGNTDMNYLHDENILKSNGAATKKKTVDQIAKEVIDGKWGNGDERKRKLTVAGYDYNAVQKKVNELLAPKPQHKTKTVSEAAKEVIDGKWGNGEDRKKRLTAAGYDYNAVQKKVNEMLQPKPVFKVRSIVRVKQGAKDYNGRNLAGFVFGMNFYIMELVGNRAVIGIDGKVTAAVNTNDLILIK